MRLLRLHPVRTAAVIALLLASTLGGRQATAAPGDLIAEVTTSEGSGPLWTRGISPSVGFDGQYLYYVEYAGSILHRINVPPAGASSAATGQVDTAIVGSSSGIMSIAYDAGRDLFWAVGGDGLTLYTLTKSGTATARFTVDPTTDRPGYQPKTFAAEVKIAYDRADDTIWYSPDAMARIYHYQTSPDALGTAAPVAATPWIDVDAAPNDMAAECGFSQSSAITVGGSDLFVGVAGCSSYFEYTKTGTKVASYPIGMQSTGDFECDNVSYPVSVIWVKDAWGGRIQAYQQPSAGACVFGGGA